MKQLMIIVAILVFGFATYNASALTICYEDVILGCCYDWDDYHTHCPNSGMWCNKTVTDDKLSKQVTVTPTSGGILITTTFTGMQFEVTNDPTFGTFTSQHDGKNYTFGASEVIKIVESDEYPSLNGNNYSLTGITTNSNGVYTVFIPIN